MDKNSNCAFICHKQDLKVIIPIYNENKMTLSQLRCSSVLIPTDTFLEEAIAIYVCTKFIFVQLGLSRNSCIKR